MAGNHRSGGDQRAGIDVFPESSPTKPRLHARQSAAWDVLMEVLPPYLLRAADVIQLTMLCELMAQAADISDAIAADPLNEKMRRLYLATCDRVQRLSGMFGLSPMDRMKMKAPSEPECDQLDDFTDMLSNVVKRN